MRQPQMSLSEPRREIDPIDDAIHELLITRAHLAERIGLRLDRTTGGAGDAILRAGGYANPFDEQTQEDSP